MNIEQSIQDNNEKIANLQSVNSKLQEQLDQIELKTWEPDKGNYLVGSNGEVREKQFIFIDEESQAFGTERVSNKQATLAANNMRRFNRLSCFMNDDRPILEFTDISVSLTFYDYDKAKLEKLKAIIQNKGTL
jgi:hypothetical protein